MSGKRPRVHRPIRHVHGDGWSRRLDTERGSLPCDTVTPWEELVETVRDGGQPWHSRRESKIPLPLRRRDAAATMERGNPPVIARVITKRTRAAGTRSSLSARVDNGITHRRSVSRRHWGHWGDETGRDETTDVDETETETRRRVEMSGDRPRRTGDFQELKQPGAVPVKRRRLVCSLG